MKKTYILSSLLFSFWESALADVYIYPTPSFRAAVVSAAPSCRDAFLIEGPTGYQLIEWLARDVPSVGDFLEGSIWPGETVVTFVDGIRKADIRVYTRPSTLAAAEQSLARRCELWAP